MSNAELLRGKRLVLGVGGGIAAYKSVELLRRLVDSGAHVIPILTDAALKFVGRNTFSALASEPAHLSIWDDNDPIPHTHIGQSADIIIVSPATADLIARYNAGIANDLLTTTLIATKAPVVLVAAMHTEMWEHPSVVANIASLRRRGVTVIDPESGRLAGGDEGVGRLASTTRIIEIVADILSESQQLIGRKVLVTAGGTREAIDPVRFIGNRSSGKQGHAIAETARAMGAEVYLVTTSDILVHQSIQIKKVVSAQEMIDEVLSRYIEFDLIVMAAAIADFRPANISNSKIKKSNGLPEITLEATPDLLAKLGSMKRHGQVLVGFAAETGDVSLEAKRKLVEKNADFIVANDVSDPNAGFEVDTNRVTIFSGDKVVKVETADKKVIAKELLGLVSTWTQENGMWT